jgi:hypothetical protein
MAPEEKKMAARWRPERQRAAGCVCVCVWHHSLRIPAYLQWGRNFTREHMFLQRSLDQWQCREENTVLLYCLTTVTMLLFQVVAATTLTGTWGANTRTELQQPDLWWLQGIFSCSLNMSKAVEQKWAKAIAWWWKWNKVCKTCDT